jgi:hypothetical protein
MLRPILIVSALVFVLTEFGMAQATVRLEPAKLDGPRLLQDQTRETAIRDYLQSWKSLKAALYQNRPNLLDPDFVGTAKAKLTDTIQQQEMLGISTEYQDRSHDIQVVFYSPEGLSIEMIDTVEYDMQILDHDKVKATQHMQAKYFIVLTPAEIRWRVRVFQGAPR